MRKDDETLVRKRKALDILSDCYQQRIIDRHQYSTMKGQALKGDVRGALVGLKRILAKR